MQVTIGDCSYEYCGDTWNNQSRLEGYFALARQTFCLDFLPWYRTGSWRGNFFTYSLWAGPVCASAVSVALSSMAWNGSRLACAQISTVMTDAAFRGKGLNRWLLEQVLREWEGRSDLLYLYANDSVTGYYPKFGFRKFQEYHCSIPVAAIPGHCRRLSPGSPADRELAMRCYSRSNPFSALSMEGNPGSLLFHWQTFLQNCFYYIEPYDAVVVAKLSETELFCYDVFAPQGNCTLEDLLGITAPGDMPAVLGFTPKDAAPESLRPFLEEDTTFFILGSPANPFAENRLMFPLLSRA